MIQICKKCGKKTCDCLICYTCMWEKNGYCTNTHFLGYLKHERKCENFSKEDLCYFWAFWLSDDYDYKLDLIREKTNDTMDKSWWVDFVESILYYERFDENDK